MNAPRDPERLVHAFLMEGQTELADQVYDAVRSTIEQQRQRVVIGPWRMPTMNKLMPIGLAAAAVVVALVVGTQLLGPPASGGVGAAPSATPSPTAEPSVAAPSRTPEGLLPEGPFVLLDGSRGSVPMTVTIPAPGWYGEPANGILVKKDAEPPNGAGMIVFDFGDGWFVPTDPCDWGSTMPDTRSTTVDELVAALAAQASRDASTPVDITVGGKAGKSITLHVPDDAVFSSCDEGQFCTLADPVASPAERCHRYHQGPGQIDNLWIVEVNGQLVVIDWNNYEGTPAEDVAELEAIVESITFE